MVAIPSSGGIFLTQGSTCISCISCIAGGFFIYWAICLLIKEVIYNEFIGGIGMGNPWLIHVNVWQKPLQYCKVISLQLIKNKWKKLINKIKSKKKKISERLKFCFKNGKLIYCDIIDTWKMQIFKYTTMNLEVNRHWFYDDFFFFWRYNKEWD